jgi:DNA-directed RNA polymerase specialized sigma24 family protein
MTAATACRTCCTQPRESARLCDAALPGSHRVPAPHVDHRLAPVLNQNGAAFVIPPEGWAMDIPETNRTLVVDAFARLSAEHRAVVRRAYYHGWTTAQIGADLGIAEGTVKSRLHQALRALQQTLQEMGVAP